MSKAQKCLKKFTHKKTIIVHIPCVIILLVSSCKSSSLVWISIKLCFKPNIKEYKSQGMRHKAKLKYISLESTISLGNAIILDTICIIYRLAAHTYVPIRMCIECLKGWKEFIYYQKCDSVLRPDYIDF